MAMSEHTDDDGSGEQTSHDHQRDVIWGREHFLSDVDPDTPLDELAEKWQEWRDDR